jgi:hypothetical protein
VSCPKPIATLSKQKREQVATLSLMLALANVVKFKKSSGGGNVAGGAQCGTSL